MERNAEEIEMTLRAIGRTVRASDEPTRKKLYEQKIKIVIVYDKR
jgi:hypothetical protein